MLDDHWLTRPDWPMVLCVNFLASAAPLHLHKLWQPMQQLAWTWITVGSRGGGYDPIRKYGPVGPRYKVRIHCKCTLHNPRTRVWTLVQRCIRRILVIRTCCAELWRNVSDTPWCWSYRTVWFLRGSVTEPHLHDWLTHWPPDCSAQVRTATNFNTRLKYRWCCRCIA